MPTVISPRKLPPGLDPNTGEDSSVKAALRLLGWDDPNQIPLIGTRIPGVGSLGALLGPGGQQAAQGALMRVLLAHTAPSRATAPTSDLKTYESRVSDLTKPGDKTAISGGPVSDSFDEIKEAVSGLANASPIVAIGKGIGKVGDLAKSMVPDFAAMVPSIAKPARGDIELPKDPKLMAGSGKQVVAENIRMLINSGMPEEKAIVTAMRHARGASAP